MLIIRDDITQKQSLVYYNQHSMSGRPRVTRADPAFVAAVADALKNYRDGENPERNTLADAELARRLGVSKSSLSKYLQEKQIIGGEALRRMLTDLSITLNYKGQEISARVLPQLHERRLARPEQISFIFEAPCTLEETAAGVAVTIEKKDVQSSELRVQIRLAG